MNQSSLTGETLPVHKRENDEVFAGTTVTEGTVIISVQKLHSETRISQIVKTIEESESLKAGIQNHAERLSDRLVPYSFLMSGLTWLVTGNPRKAASTLLVDYSCSLKLATPLTIMSAMISASRNGVLIKGGKYIEALSKADTYVLDKTGTLTEARPEILDVIPFNRLKRDFLLKSAAGVEERFTHPVASAVVDKAKQEGLEFSCSYTDAEYIVAHGVKSTVEGNSFLVGSRHFLEDDNAIDFTPYSDTIRDLQDKGLSSLYIAFKSELAGVITFTDPIRNDAKDFISGSKQLGVKKHIMLTGDQLNSAARVAENLMIEQFRAEVFPEEKAEIVSELQSQGSVVAMIGDGMNDSPALALADIGISLKQGADIAKETCNILLLNSDLQSINHTKVLSKKAITRIQTNFYCIIGINSVLIGLGLIGKIQPAVSAFLHNASTIAVSLNALRRI